MYNEKPAFTLGFVVASVIIVTVVALASNSGRIETKDDVLQELYDQCQAKGVYVYKNQILKCEVR